MSAKIATGSATKLRNSVAKLFGGEKISQFGMTSNLYSSSQELPIIINYKNYCELKELLKEEGWVKHLTDSFSKENNTLSIVKIEGSSKKEHKLCIRCYGIKKAKRSNLPYYD
jgi:hypothetical protein